MEGKWRKPGFGIRISSIISCMVVMCGMWSTAWAGKVVYPWRATTAIVKAGETFEVWYVASSGQTVNSVELKGPYNTVLASRSVATGTWKYDHESGKTYNQKITVPFRLVRQPIVMTWFSRHPAAMKRHRLQ